MTKRILENGALCAFFCLSVLFCPAQSGFDSGLRPRELLRELKGSPKLSAAAAQWLRVRGVAKPESWLTTWFERRALKGIRAKGHRVCVLVTPDSLQWKSGVRAKGYLLPLDLGEAYRYGRRLGEVYGDVVDAWEIGNEPDIGFVPENAENYAAYLKAVYLGIKAGAGKSDGGRRTGENEGGRTEDGRLNTDAGRSEVGGSAPTFEPSTLSSQLSTTHSSLVLMAPLALPPGPYFEALTRNGVFSYTDGFNYHYYGYAEDFSGVYRQFEKATQELVTDNANGSNEIVSKGSGRPVLSLASRGLPVFLTEYGYGTLSGAAGGTVEGRIRQWQWFRDVSAQIDRLRIEGPMAFYLPPYLENGTQEFGLTMIPMERGKKKEDNETPNAFTAGGLMFQPRDFGTNAVEPWMNNIGRNVGQSEASPALAWLLDDRMNGSTGSHGWPVASTAASRVVIDFVAGRGMLAVKQCQGYFLSGAADGSSAGEGELRIYNFGSSAVLGRLNLGRFAHSSEAVSEMLSIAPGEMRAVPLILEMEMTGEDLLPHKWSVRFTEERAGLTDSVFVTQLFPDASRMSRRVVTELGEAEAGSRSALVLDTRATEAAEPKEEKSGRWRLTKGVKVSEHSGTWAFTVSGYPAEPLRPAIAELVLPDGFQMPEGSLLEFEYRLATRTSDNCLPVPEPRAPVQVASVSRELIGIYWRTENGNHYTVWQTLLATNNWQKYAQAKGSFTMGFYGRANPPWRFADNRPVALVFTFRPNFLPATFEVKNAAITSYGRP